MIGHHKHSESQYQNQKNFQQLTSESKNMVGKIDELAKQISKQYSILLSGGEQEPITFEEFSADISIPQLGQIDQEDDLQMFISDLDKQFAQWDGRELTKDGKV